MKEKKNKGNTTPLWEIMKPVNGYIFSAMSLASLGAIAVISTFLMLSLLVSVLIQEDHTILFWGIQWQINNTLIGIGLLGASAFILTGLGFVVSHLGAFKLEEILRTVLASHLAELPLGYIITTGTGSLKKVMLEDVKNLHVFVADSTPTIGRIYTAPFVTAIALFVIDWRLALISLGVLIAGMAILRIAFRDSTIMQKEYEQSQGQISGAVIEFIQAMAVVRTFDDGTSSFRRYQKALDRFKKVFIEWMKISDIPSRLSIIIIAPLPTLLSVLTAGIYFIGEETLAVPSLIAFLFLTTGMVDAFMPIMWLNNFIRKSKASAVRIQEVIEVPAMPMVTQGKVPEEMTVCFDSVSFIYENRREKALENISFTVKPGTTTALVGPSGAGKSTVAKLLPRFWDVTSGSITIGGVDVREMTSHDLMDIVTFVFQDTFLFHDTLANNIKMSKKEATDQEMIEAAKAAQIHDFIMTLPEGYETHVGDRGARLSGGQRQRITIARAILRNSPIVVLDEATAFADPESEEEILKAMAYLTKDKTVITIAHRLMTISHVDQILVFDKGTIVERGKHDDLIASEGLYSALWANYETARQWDLHVKGAVHVR